MLQHSVMWQERAQSMWDACTSAHNVLSLGLRQAAFEAIFASFDKGNKGGLTLQEMYQFTQATRLVRLRHATGPRLGNCSLNFCRPCLSCALFCMVAIVCLHAVTT